MNANALSPYRHNWTKIKSDHFTIVVDENHVEYGKLVANKAELAFDALKKFSKKHPKNTVIIIDHTKGFSNGSASFFPYPTITLQPVPPAPSASVGQYDDWLYELLIHEYTHILTFHNTRNLFTPLRWALGSAFSPGYLMPTWYQEGIAVFTESHLSDGGRLRSSSYKAFNKELKGYSISIANETSTGNYPFGSNPYIYGAWLNEKSFSGLGMEGASKVHRTFSGRFPYLINGGYKKHTNKSLYKIWRETFSTTKDSIITKESFPGRLPFWDKTSQTTYFIKKGPTLLDEFVQRDQSGKDTVLFKVRSILNYKVHKGSVYYLNLQLSEKNSDGQVFALQAFDLKTKKTKAVSKLENIQSFDLNSQDQVVFTDARLNEQRLKITSLNDFAKSKTLLKTKPEVRLAFARFENKDNILFSIKKPKQNEELRSLNIYSLTGETLLTEPHIVGLFPDSDSFSVLTEANGLKHLHHLADSSKTLIHSGIMSITRRADQSFTVSRITNKGLYIFNMSLGDLKSFDNSPVAIKNEASDLSPSDETLTLSKYSSLYFPNLLPHYIVPGASFSPYGFSGEFLYSLSIGSQDPLSLNAYSLSLSTDTITERASGRFNYTSRHFRMPISFSAGLFNQPLSLTLFRESTFATLGSSYTFRSSLTKSFTLSFGGIWNSTEIGGGNTADRTGASASLFYNSSKKRARELAPRKGGLFKLSARHYIPGKNNYDYTQANFGLRLFAKSPLVKTHRFVFGLDAEINSKPLAAIFSSNSLNLPYRSAATGSLALRGLPTGAIFATDSFALSHLEYRFPLLNINWAPGLLPGFFKRVTAALTADYGFVKGFDFLRSQFIDYSTPLYSAGAEITFEGKLFYHLPASLQIGAYKFLNTDVYDSSPEIFVGFGLSGLPY